ncbi:hypothetical protein [Gaetbulibacter saemankumensis]|uniref:hypothetical protein n=1 Tax=Gaetbulibacter saemankumensis TaxID=311208 RepID=UPI0003F6490B|nr:hypothetical protein [Gaetbulibacter saemankumensis]
MTKSIFKALLILITVFSCNQKQTATTTDETQNNSQEITEKDLSKLKYTEFNLDINTEKLITNWAEYYQIKDAVGNIKKGDLSYFNDNEKGVKNVLRDFRKNIPEGVNTEAILARISAFETKLLKLQSLANLSTTKKAELISSIKEFLIAFSNLNLQMNKKAEADKTTIEKP